MNIEECFFCDAPLSMHIMKDDFYYWVTCLDCLAEGPVKESEEQAITAWNDVARIVRKAREAEK